MASFAQGLYPAVDGFTFFLSLFHYRDQVKVREAFLAAASCSLFADESILQAAVLFFSPCSLF